MIKKALLAVIAAGALSVPLAGVAWADPPSDNNPPGQGTTGPGLPHEVGSYLAGANANPKPVTPGQLFNMAKEGFGGPGVSTPEAIGGFVNFIYNSHLGPTPPGMGTKTFTPACASGRRVSDPAINDGGLDCH